MHNVLFIRRFVRNDVVDVRNSRLCSSDVSTKLVFGFWFKELPMHSMKVALDAVDDALQIDALQFD